MAAMSVVNILRNTACTVLVFFLLEVASKRIGGIRRSITRVSSSSRIRHSRVSSTATKAAIVGGLLFGSAAYMSRRRYRNGYYQPTVCQNIQYGRFICPMASQPDSYGYCCGYAGEESCCQASSGSGGGGRIAGIVIASVLVVVGLGVMIVVLKNIGFFKSKPTTTTRPAAGMAFYDATAPTNQWQHDKSDMQKMNDPYPDYHGGVAPYPTGVAHYPVSPAPSYSGNMGHDGSTQVPYQAYATSGGPPYPVSPMSDSPPPYPVSPMADSAPPYPVNTGVSLDPPPSYNTAISGGYGCQTDRYPPNTSSTK